MGRTKRRRNRRKSCNSTADFGEEIKNLTQFMKKFGWKNVSKLKLKNFENSGRGLTSSKNLKIGDILIEAPLELLITPNTILQNKNFMEILKPGLKFKIQDVLALFLVFERRNLESEWKFYLESLPKTEVCLPWMNSEHFPFFPKHLREICEKLLQNFLESWGRLEDIFQAQNFEFNEFLWGYTMVNTRAVFIDPNYCENRGFLMDEPNLALFPFMDMFNHADDAENSVEIRENPQSFLIKTLKNQRKNRQIYISYGRHDNLKLFTEYGFYLPKNLNNKLIFKPEDILKVLNLKLGNFQYNFLKKHEFLSDLFINFTGVSFKLKGLLYVALNDVKNYDFIVYSGNFGEDFMEKLRSCAGKLVGWKISEYKNDVCKFEGCKNEGVLGFLENRLRFPEELSKIINDFT